MEIETTMLPWDFVGREREARLNLEYKKEKQEFIAKL